MSISVSLAASCFISGSALTLSGMKSRLTSHLDRLPSTVVVCHGTDNDRIPSRRDGDAQNASGHGMKRGEVKTSRRELLLKSSSAALLATILDLSGKRPEYLGVQTDPPSLALCPPTPNCISTSEELNDPGHYVPPWSYNPADGRGRKNPVSKEKAMSELVEVVTKTKPDNYTSHIVKSTEDYLYVEYVSPNPLFKLVDDVEFWFPPGNRSVVEYRSASRFGQSDFDVNRKRIRALRLALEKKGWESVGY